LQFGDDGIAIRIGLNGRFDPIACLELRHWL
jgi:hypothetical protein